MPEILKLSFEFSPKIGVRELPELDARHQSNVPGLYVIGDLADAPIIKVALRQGYEVARQLAGHLAPEVALRSARQPAEGPEPAPRGVTPVLVVGAGPAGIGAALALRELGVDYVHIEREVPFATIQNFPRNKLIFSEPQSLENPANFWFADARTGELVERWEEAIRERQLVIRQPEALISLERVRAEGGWVFRATTEREGERATIQARVVLLATGRRGTVKRLDIPGEELEKVRYNVRDPAEHRGRDVLVLGGGDSAVETAVDLAEAGARVTLAHRGTEFSRPKERNKARVQAAIAEGKLRAELGSVPREIRPEAVVLERGGQRFEVPNDDVVVQIGTTLPDAWLRSLGLRMAGDLTAGRIAGILGFAALTWCFYVLKQGRAFFPFGEGQLLGALPGLLRVDLGFREADPAFWGTCVYSLLVTVFGLRARRRYPSPTQQRRYSSLILFQLVFLFGIPELIAPLLIDRPWKLYALSVPWPLSIWSLVDAPGWTPDGDTATALGWLGLGALTSFVLIPLYVRKNGEKFCSYLCGCGGLAEGLGDAWRELAPRGRTAKRAELSGRVILALALPVTLLILNDAWGFFASGALYNAKEFAQRYYGLVVDFGLASVLGVALYPYLGNRVWCRFFCPLRAYMELLARRFARVAIHADSKCIGCGECTRFCQMGIDVQAYAQRQKELSNADSACIQCGICIEVCPMDVLRIGPRGEVSLRI